MSRNPHNLPAVGPEMTVCGRAMLTAAATARFGDRDAVRAVGASNHIDQRTLSLQRADLAGCVTCDAELIGADDAVLLGQEGVRCRRK